MKWTACFWEEPFEAGTIIPFLQMTVLRNKVWVSPLQPGSVGPVCAIQSLYYKSISEQLNKQHIPLHLWHSKKVSSDYYFTAKVRLFLIDHTDAFHCYASKAPQNILSTSKLWISPFPSKFFQHRWSTFPLMVDFKQNSCKNLWIIFVQYLPIQYLIFLTLWKLYLCSISLYWSS